MRSTNLAFLTIGMALLAQGAAAQEAGPQRGGDERVGDEALAGGQEGSLQLPTSLQARPLTLPGGVLRWDAGVDVLRVMQVDGTAAGIHLGLGYGITDDFEVGGVLLPLQAFIGSTDGEVGFGDISLYGQYRFVRGDVEVGARLDVTLPTRSWSTLERPVWLGFGIPVLLRLGDVARIDTGVQVAMRLNPEFGSTLNAAGSPLLRTYPLPTRSATGVPFVLTVNATEQIYLGLRTGARHL
jgi:hypothetical protein